MKQGIQQILKPIFRWPGGKSWLVDMVSDNLKVDFINYHEPFMGGAALFIKLKSAKRIKCISYLSDANSNLVNAYRQVKNNEIELGVLLREYINSEDYYYYIRGREVRDKLVKAADFIYLNRTCFNGLYRVNKAGKFNVPYGHKTYKALFEFDNIAKLSRLLKSNVRLSCEDFYDSIHRISKGDLIFIDPPYTVNHENNGFIQYNENLFSWEDQIRLEEFIKAVIKKKAYYILTNAKHKSIKDLFGNLCKPLTVERPSLIGGKNAKRGIIHEYVFSNCL